MNSKNFLGWFLVAAVAAAFYITLNNIAGVRNDLRSLEIAIHLLGEKGTPVGTIVGEGRKDGISLVPPKNNQNQNAPSETDLITIPTAIIFEVQSGPALQPQVSVPIIVESVSKNSEGQVRVQIKAFTSEASSYSAIEPRDLFELIDLKESNQKPVETTGNFDSMPPKSVATGSVIFKVKPEQKNIIIQINMAGGKMKHYEFNFEKKTYKEIVLG